ncbi:long-chain-fatty-acid--CoA ligase ACSBG2 isoform X2 [Nematostella vectensis]|uniref:long-chain-fatty-acid--CoA ligase ACSBG2 isoform X2 n=1 Tax=Nematostella vectensis TaxID=45351 RepID=UPI0020778E8C|nr:long-chain-fatty-acid--CoA ligase ACSBG2 isoform X2 [Nematostella vectensis]
MRMASGSKVDPSEEHSISVSHRGENGQNGINGHAEIDKSAGQTNRTTLSMKNTQEKTAKNLAPANDFWTTEADGAVKIRMGESDATKGEPMTVVDLLERTVKRSPNRIAMGVKRNDQWQHWTYSEYYEEVRIAAKSFIELGLEQYHGVGIIGFNSPEWFISEIGAIFAGGFAVGIYTTNSPEACHFVADNCNANVIVVENKAQLSKILKVWDRLPHLKAVVQYTGEVEGKHENVYNWNQFLELGKTVADRVLQERMSQLVANRCCTLIYTSGTTGAPKGVMISHDNITWTAQAALNHVQAGKREEHIVSYLPLSHVAAQMTDIYMSMYCCGTVWFAQPDALKGSLVNTLRECRPTLFLGVPRVWEKIMEKMLEVGATVTGPKRRIADWAKGKALQGNMNIEQGRSTPFGWTIATGILKKIKVSLGLDRCWGQFVAAAPVTMETLCYFQSINIPLYELYGMSECSGPLTISIPGHVLSGSCGIKMEGTEMKIDKPDEDGNGELCMRGRNVFMGFLNNEEKTKEALDVDGWLHSGDVCKIDDKGKLFITGRIKELIITAGGENIAPVPIEDNIKKEVPLISNAILIGDKRKFLSCLLTLKVEVEADTGAPTDRLTKAAIAFCKSVGSEATTVSEILKTKDENVMKAIQAGVDRANEEAISRAQKVQKWCILENDFTIHGGELGPTMKLRRPIVSKMYKDTIDALYK